MVSYKSLEYKIRFSFCHYRFGNITTMEWWTYLYLKEGLLLDWLVLHFIDLINRICDLGMYFLLYHNELVL